MILIGKKAKNLTLVLTILMVSMPIHAQILNNYTPPKMVFDPVEIAPASGVSTIKPVKKPAIHVPQIRPAQKPALTNNGYITAPAVPAPNVQTVSLAPVELEENTIRLLENKPTLSLVFEDVKRAIDEEKLSQIDMLANYLGAHPEKKVTVVANAKDTKLTSRQFLHIGLQIRDQLVAGKIDPKRITILSEGERIVSKDDVTIGISVDKK